MIHLLMNKILTTIETTIGTTICNNLFHSANKISYFIRILFIKLNEEYLQIVNATLRDLSI